MVTIHGSFPGMNEFISANRRVKGRWNAGNQMKQRDQAVIRMQLPKVRLHPPIYLRYRYYCPNRKKDLDNISGYFHKVFQDALVDRGILDGDGWKYIVGFSDAFEVDRTEPRIEVEMIEVDPDDAQF